MTKKQKQFALEYLKDFNGARAYKEAYNCNNENTARKHASRLLRTNGDLRAFIEQETEKINNAKICDVQEIRELLGKANNMFTDKVDLNANMDINVEIEDNED